MRIFTISLISGRIKILPYLPFLVARHTVMKSFVVGILLAAVNMETFAVMDVDHIFSVANNTVNRVQGSGLPLPRFVSLRLDKVNMRTGPGTQYPVKWTYTRRNYPVEITAEFDIWRLIRDREGNEGWVHQVMLTGQRTFVVLARDSIIRSQPSESEEFPIVARLEEGVIGGLLQCPATTSRYCRVKVQNHVGWLKRDDFWGVQRDEFIQ